MGKLLGIRDNENCVNTPVVHLQSENGLRPAFHVTHNPRLAVDLQDPLNWLHGQQYSQTLHDRVCNLVRSVDWKRERRRFATAIRMKNDVEREKGQ